MKIKQTNKQDNLLPTSRIIELLMMQDNVFEAVAEIRNINSLNGYNVIDDYTEYLIKQHYKELRNSVNVEECSSSIVKSITRGNVEPNTNTQYNPYRELQKGYMKLGCI